MNGIFSAINSLIEEWDILSDKPLSIGEQVSLAEYISEQLGDRLSLAYMEFLKDQFCICTVTKPAERSHLKHARGYKGKPCHRHFTAVSMIHEVHMDWHTMTRVKFEEKYNVNVWQENVRMLIRFLTGKEME